MNISFARVTGRISISFLIIVGMLIFASISLAAGFFEIVQGLDHTLFIQLIGLALLSGWFASGRIKSGWISLTVGLIFGVLAIWLRLGQLSGKVWLLIWQSADYLGHLRISLFEGAPSIAPLTTAWSSLQSAAITVSLRIYYWLEAFIRGKAAFDPVAVNFFWGVWIWIVVFWSAWAAYRRYQAIQVLLPGIILSVGLLGYANEYSMSIFGSLAALLLFCVIANHIHHEAHWQHSQIDFTTEIRLDLATIAIPILIAILLISILIPTISIREIVSAVQSWTDRQNPHAENVGLPLGVRPKPREAVNNTFIDYENPGLPREHLIGSGPELSERTVMTIRTFELPAMPAQAHLTNIPPHYWTGISYDRYNGTGWSTTALLIQTITAGKSLSKTDPSRFRALHQEITRTRSEGSGIGYYSGRLISSNQTMEVARRSQTDLFATSIRAQSYIVDSEIPNYSRQELASAGQDYPDWVRSKYLQLPPNLPERVRSLARDITASSLTPYDQAKAIEAYLRNFPYNLDIPAPPQNRDIVDYFLFDLKEGYCDYYASAMVVLARSVGIPARLVTGYSTGTYDPENSRYIISEADAHSWPEIYFPGYDWVEFEPTAGRAGIDYEKNLPVLPNDLAKTNIPGSSGTQTANELINRWGTAGLIGLMGIGLFGLLLWTRIQTYRLAHAPAEKITWRLYRQLRRTAARMNIPLSTGDTPLELSDRIKMDFFKEPDRKGDRGNEPAAYRHLDALVRLYIQAAYSPSLPTHLQAAQGIEEWNSLRISMILIWLRRKVFRR